MTVEIGNTDAEGRLVLADALTLGDEEAPELMIDMATLTGAARVALGPDLPAFYCDDEEFTSQVTRAAATVADPMWRMPLWEPYAKNLSSEIADINNFSAGPFAGSVTAALFLQKFVGAAKVWAHIDLFAWNPTTRPGRPHGGETQVIRAIYEVLKDRYG
jgi:leucyl aminopeptidase